MNAIEVTARGAIHEGKLEEFKLLAAECMRTVREKDSGTLQYDWFLNEAQTECVVRETYRNSEAVLEHVANLGATMGAILTVCDWTFEVFGSPSPELVKAAAGLRPKVYSPFQSMRLIGLARQASCRCRNACAAMSLHAAEEARIAALVNKTVGSQGQSSCG